MHIMASNSRSNVIPFQDYMRHDHRLTTLDHLDISNYRQRAEAAGYDRLIIHTIDPAEGIEIAEYLCAYHTGEAWSRFGFARYNAAILAWSTVSHKDLGSFARLADALRVTLQLMHDPRDCRQTPAYSVFHGTGSSPTKYGPGIPR